MGNTVRFAMTWAVDPIPTAAVLAAAGTYLWGVTALPHRRPGRTWPRRRTASFLAGLTLALLVVIGPIGAFDRTFFWSHMVQHIALMMVIPPLLLLGAPVLLALEVARPATRKRWMVPVLRSRTVRWLTDPIVTWVLFATVLIGTHFSPFYQFALTHEWVHRFVEHPLYFTVGLLYFYPLIGSNPVPHGPPPIAKVASLVLMMVPETMTGFFLYSSTHVFYPWYAQALRPWGLAPLIDQQFGGALMWTLGMLIDSIWIALAVLAWLRSEHIKARRIDRMTADRAAGNGQITA